MIAALAVVEAAADVVGAVVIIFAAAMLAASLEQNRKFLSGFPIVGNTLAGIYGNVVQTINDALVSGGIVLVAILVDAVHLMYVAINSLIHALTDWIEKPLSNVIGLANATSQAVQGLEQWQTFTLPQWISENLTVPLSKAIGLVNATNQAVQGLLQWQNVTLPQWITDNLTKPLSAVIGLANVTSLAVQQLQGAMVNLANVVFPAIYHRIDSLEQLWANVIVAPVTGIVPRLRAVEQGLIQLAPLSLILLTIPQAVTNLRNIAEDDCYCFKSGDLSDNGTLELAELMDLI